MARLSEKIMITLILLVLVGWAGYHGFRYYHSPIQTEAAFEYTVSRSLRASDGIAIREEQVVEETARGTASYLYADGTKVSVRQTIVEYYDSDVSDKGIRRMRDIEQELEMLRSAQDTTINHFSNTEILNRDIRDQLSALTAMSGTGRYDQVADVKYNLTSLLNKKQIATGKASGYSNRIDELENEHKSLSSESSPQAVVSVRSPAAGYFSKTVDRYVGALSPAVLENSTVETIREIITSGDDTSQSGYAGKLCTGQKWYYAALVSGLEYDLQWVREGQEVSISFDETTAEVPAVLEQIVTEPGSEDVILVFSCTRMSEELVNLRHTGAAIRFYQHTGLRVSTESIRYVDGVRGVYVLENNTVRFKTVTPLYEEQTFILSAMNYFESVDKKNVRLFDQVIVKGTDLYDGKVIGQS